MDRKEDYKIENLTMLQIQYLIELNKLEKKKGAVRMIAAKCGVNHSQVSRFFKKCIEEGELTESLDFTENGKRKFVDNLPIKPEEIIHGNPFESIAVSYHNIYAAADSGVGRCFAGDL